MLPIAIISGIFGTSGDVYKEDMSVEHFKNNYNTIVEDVKKGNKLDDVTRAFADIAPEYPDAVTENGSHLYKNYTNDDPNVQMNSMTALVRADLAVERNFLGEDSINALNYSSFSQFNVGLETDVTLRIREYICESSMPAQLHRGLA